MSSSSKRARLRYAESTRDFTNVPDTYNQRRKEVQKVTERIANDDQEEFDDFTTIGDQQPQNAAIEEAFDTYNALRYFIYNASLPSSSKSNVPRICFLHQLYSILPDNTAVDRELVSPKDGMYDKNPCSKLGVCIEHFGAKHDGSQVPRRRHVRR